MLLKNEIPWHIVAIVFIAFASWVWNKFQEVAAERKRRKFQQVKRSYEKQERQQTTLSTPPSPPVQPKSALEQMMDAMTGNVEEIRRQQELAEAQRRSHQQKRRPQQPAPQRTVESPPPLPRKQEPVRSQRPPQTATVESTARPLRNAVPKVALNPVSRRKKRQSSIRSLLRGQDSLRHALIASEILQKPKGLDQ